MILSLRSTHFAVLFFVDFRSDNVNVRKMIFLDILKLGQIFCSVQDGTRISSSDLCPARITGSRADSLDMNGDCILEVGIISGISSRFRLPLDKISKISALEKIFSNNFLIFPIWKNFRPEIWCSPIGYWLWIFQGL